jgi:hypothetical protein
VALAASGMTDRQTVAGLQAADPALNALPVLAEAVVLDFRDQLMEGRLIVDPGEAELCPERLPKLSP